MTQKDYSDIDKNAKIIWDYMLMHHTLVKADVIFILGNRTTAVPKYAATLYHKGLAPYVICSGGHGKGARYDTTEAEMFRDILVEHGVPEEKIILETHATNTGQNVALTEALLREKGFDFRRFILVQKPHMERRSYATFMKQWKGEIEDVRVSSPQLTYEAWCLLGTQEDKDGFIHTMVGDLRRIMEYPKLGHQIPQEVPQEVVKACERLREAGYIRYYTVV
jgi:uncharacterized SAM-binding protein YcdF (DUF218 family)